MTTLVIGVGNDMRRDDGVGHVIADLLASSGADIRRCNGDPLEIVDWLSEVDSAVIVDAVVSGAAPGTIHVIDAIAEPTPAYLHRRSTHLLGLGEAIEMARSLERLPESLTIIGVEAGDVTPGRGLGPDVAAAVAPAMAVVNEVMHRA